MKAPRVSCLCWLSAAALVVTFMPVDGTGSHLAARADAPELLAEVARPAQVTISRNILFLLNNIPPRYRVHVANTLRDNVELSIETRYPNVASFHIKGVTPVASHYSANNEHHVAGEARTSTGRHLHGEDSDYIVRINPAELPPGWPFRLRRLDRRSAPGVRFQMPSALLIPRSPVGPLGVTGSTTPRRPTEAEQQVLDEAARANRLRPASRAAIEYDDVSAITPHRSGTGYWVQGSGLDPSGAVLHDLNMIHRHERKRICAGVSTSGPSAQMHPSRKGGGRSIRHAVAVNGSVRLTIPNMMDVKGPDVRVRPSPVRGDVQKSLALVMRAKSIVGRIAQSDWRPRAQENGTFGSPASRTW
ncbi:hypothetical protein IE81DRAFT_357501 [Ceraceosorus guamensis]|uniref:Uncharacterized protein n=1 Tax=Ceraceosorus guamensis TaxID=1522189 RepID=A0A316W077_9BASI|nr:hypothetical protein IE81DRAFT_357501 [Ceraceosorus guamensis]PWN42113.1 hypothetical protein IE81DRAFT_357501 [Ceraceosorus guamensis]